MRQLCKGNVAIVKGAIMAGCRSFYGYPITPASEIAERNKVIYWEAGATADTITQRGFNYLFRVVQLGSNLGIFACGVLGKKLGYKRMVVAGLLAAVPRLFLFPHATGLLAALLLCLGGAALAPSMPGLTVIGQELLPGRQALAASLIMGLGVGVGGVASGVLGLIADHAGLPCTLVLLALMPLVSGLLACALPRPELALRKLAP